MTKWAENQNENQEIPKEITSKQWINVRDRTGVLQLI